MANTYNISELNEMTSEELDKTAKSLGLEIAPGTSQMNIIYAILDRQAVLLSQKFRSKRGESKDEGVSADGDNAGAKSLRRKRGPGRKNNTVSLFQDNQLAPEEGITPETAVDTPPVKRKRGRPRKSESAPVEKESDAGKETEEQTEPAPESVQKNHVPQVFVNKNANNTVLNDMMGMISQTNNNRKKQAEAEGQKKEGAIPFRPLRDADKPQRVLPEAGGIRAAVLGEKPLSAKPQNTLQKPNPSPKALPPKPHSQRHRNTTSETISNPPASSKYCPTDTDSYGLRTTTTSPLRMTSTSPNSRLRPTD